MLSSINPIPSIFKKFLMAISGLILAGFVLVHMAGNLQMFISAEQMNEYAHFLQTLPYGLLWVFRTVLLSALIVHVWMAILLTRENQRARPQDYLKSATVQATVPSKYMGITGSILLIFIFFHISHFTLRIVFPEFQGPEYMTKLSNGQEVYDVYKMVLAGFSHTWVSIFYIVSMGLLCMHLSHGVSSMFQSLGFRNSKWKRFLDKLSNAYGWIVFLGFISVPVLVLLAIFGGINFFPTHDIFLN